MFVFAGRKPNIEVALPFYRRILEQNLDTELHIWDLARDPEDSEYLRTIEGERITVKTAFYGPIASRGQVRVWKYYASPQYADCIFTKLDDDDLFLETDSYPSFVQAAQDNPDKVISALTINNGASTRLIPDIWALYQQLDIPLLDVHLSAEYAEQSHRWFNANWQTLAGQPAKLVPADTWVSINAIAYTWEMGCKIAALLGTRPPTVIMDREYPYRTPQGRLTRYKVGDEGAVNMQPVLIHQGFVAGHFSFGPQSKLMDDGLQAELRKLYADIANQYLT